jgi:Tfp pilus assembly protein PilZ
VRIDLRLTSQADWIKVFDPRDGTVFVPMAKPVPIGEQVRIDLVVGDSGPSVILRGQVVAQRDEPPTGVMVALAPSEREKINYVNGFVRGGLLNLREKRRLPIRLDVTYGGTTGPCVTVSKDINEEGIFVLTDQPLPETSQVHLILTVPGHAEPLSLTGVVSHTVVPEDEDVPGMGIVFKLDETQRGKLRELVDELEAALKTGKLPNSATE